MPNLPPSFWQIDALGTAGFALAVVLACLQFQRRIRKLTVKITDVDILGHSGATFFVVLRIAAVNPSSEGKTIGRFQIQQGNKYQITTVRPTVDISTGLATFAPLGVHTKTKMVRQNEIVSYPLDVPAHGSIAFCHCVSVFPISLPPPDRPDMEPQWDKVPLEAADISWHKIASTPFHIPVFPASRH